MSSDQSASAKERTGKKTMHNKKESAKGNAGRLKRRVLKFISEMCRKIQLQLHSPQFYSEAVHATQRLYSVTPAAYHAFWMQATVQCYFTLNKLACQFLTPKFTIPYMSLNHAGVMASPCTGVTE
jgi:hypothetical protein